MVPERREGSSSLVVGELVGRRVRIRPPVLPLVLVLPAVASPPLLPPPLQAPVIIGSKVGLHGNPSSNLTHANSEKLPSPGGLYPKNVGVLQNAGWMH